MIVKVVFDKFSTQTFEIHSYNINKKTNIFTSNRICCDLRDIKAIYFYQGGKMFDKYISNKKDTSLIEDIQNLKNELKKYRRAKSQILEYSRVKKWSKIFKIFKTNGIGIEL